MKRSTRSLSLSFVQLCLLSAFSFTAAFGQTFGAVTGRVSDASGAPVPNAAVEITNASTNAVRATVTTDSGDYSFPSVPPGAYDVKVERQGFKAETTRNVSPVADQAAQLYAVQEAYRRLAGEAEARNVQTRRNMSLEDRRAQPPWTTEDVPREKQIVRGGK